jgi:ATP-dependent Clp protease ATP-binding subunit ClpA
MRPELLGKFGYPYVFRPLGREAQREIAVAKLEQLIEWQKEKGRLIAYEPMTVNFLVQRGFSSRLGARPLLDAIEEYVGNAVAQNLLAGGSGGGHLMVRHGQLELVS